MAPTPAPGGCPNGEPDANGFGWKSGNTVVIGDDEGTAQVTQNSQNLAFYATLIDNDPNTAGIQPYTFGPGEFDVVMILKRHGGGDGDKKTVLHVVFDVGATPEGQTP